MKLASFHCSSIFEISLKNIATSFLFFTNQAHDKSIEEFRMEKIIDKRKDETNSKD